MASITVEECSTQLFDHICVFIVTALKLPQTYEFLSNCFNFLRFVKTTFCIFIGIYHLYLYFYLYRFLVCKFKNLLFAEQTFISDFCFQALNYSNCDQSDVRNQAAALLFLLMKEYFIFDSSHFHQMTVFITTAISKLVGRGLKVCKN